MKPSVLRLSIVLSILAGLLAPETAAGAPPNGNDTSKAQAHARINGEVVPIEAGSIIYQGRALNQSPESGSDQMQKSCVFDDRIGVGAEVPEGEVPLEIVWTVQEDCSVVVTSITPMQPMNEPLPSGGAGVIVPGVTTPDVNANYTLYGSGNEIRSIYLGWVKGIVQEQFGVTSTERYTEFKWLQSPSSVQRPYGNEDYCYHSSFPGWWSIENCYASLHDSAPGLVWKEAWGDYEYRPCPLCQGIGWRHYVVFDAYPGGWAYDCFLNGSLPPSWDHRCRGGRDLVYRTPPGIAGSAIPSLQATLLNKGR